MSVKQYIPGQKKMPRARGTAGMKADPSCKRQAIFPVFSTITLAANPIKIPNAVHNCQPMTRAPRIWAGEFSAANTGTVDPTERQVNM